jgi:hypothetical protein
MDKKQLKESVEFFDQFVNAALSNDLEKFPALEVVKNYNIVKAELAKLLLEGE